MYLDRGWNEGKHLVPKDTNAKCWKEVLELVKVGTVHQNRIEWSLQIYEFPTIFAHSFWIFENHSQKTTEDALAQELGR